MKFFRATRRADQDIEDIYLYGHMTFGRQAADRYVTGLREVFQLLADHPGIARERHEIVPPVRLHPHGSQVVVYHEDADGILVVRVLSGRMDWQWQLEDR